MQLQLLKKVKNAVCVLSCLPLRDFTWKAGKRQSKARKNGIELLQLLMTGCNYNFIRFPMCGYNFNVAVKISVNLAFLTLEVIDHRLDGDHCPRQNYDAEAPDQDVAEKG